MRWAMRVRTLMLGVAAVAAVLGLLIMPAQAERRQRVRDACLRYHDFYAERARYRADGQAPPVVCGNVFDDFAAVPRLEGDPCRRIAAARGNADRGLWLEDVAFHARARRRYEAEAGPARPD